MSGDGTNTLANKMIERVPHPCKFSQCEVKDYLKEIKEHEDRCPERTVKCPHLTCNDEVKVSEYQKHAMATSTCNLYYDELSRTIRWTCPFNKGNGESLESVLLKNWCWKMRAFEDHGKLFFVHMHFSSEEKMLAFYVTIAEHLTIAKKYLAKMTLKNQNNDRKPLSITQDVISMDSAPSDLEAVLASESVMFVPWKTMSRFLKWKDQTRDGKQRSRTSIEATIDILVN